MSSTIFGETKEDQDIYQPGCVESAFNYSEANAEDL